MTVEEEIRDLGKRARAASRALRTLETRDKNAALLSVAEALEAAEPQIAAANAEDVAAARAAGLAPALVDRLTLTPARFRAMVDGVRFVAQLPDPVGETLLERDRPSGIHIVKVREPLGVVAVVFESRPNVFVDTAALCFKTSNAIILRGGKEALRSNRALAEAVQKGLARWCGTAHPSVLLDAVLLVQTTDHAGVRALVRMPEYVDVAIPRGGERLIRAMCEAALVPVLKHYKGVCHVYVDDKADLAMALAILDNAKVQRPSACNAAECLLVDRAIAAEALPVIAARLAEKQVELRADAEACALLPNALPATDSDWGREYNDYIMAVHIVSGVDEAIDFIARYGTGHSECIVTDNPDTAERFLARVDAAAVYHNASTRFTDGGEFGLGAEIGISTQKLHARGPLGLEELTSMKYIVHGTGQVR